MPTVQRDEYFAACDSERETPQTAPPMPLVGWFGCRRFRLAVPQKNVDYQAAPGKQDVRCWPED
jgi:hypothetical protein